MGTVYRKSWTALNGWGYQLDIIPYDSNYDDTVTTLSAAEAMLIDVGIVADKYDELPIGMAPPTTMTITVVINKLPSALQTYLRTKEFGGARNTFILQTNGGGNDQTILFCGVQAQINSTVYQREQGNYIVEIELTDAIQWVMASTSPASTPEWAAWSPTGASFGRVFEYRGQGNDGYYDSIYDFSLLGGGYKIYMHSWNATLEKVAAALHTAATAKALRGTTIVNAFDRNNKWRTEPMDICAFYEQTEVSNASARARTAALTHSTALLCTHVVTTVGVATAWPITYAVQNIGGLTAAGDKYGWTGYESWWDVFKDLCETLFIRASYTYTRVSGLSVEWSVSPVMAASSGSFAFDTSLDEPEIEETATAISKAEVRYQTEYPDGDTTEYVNNADAARADRSFNVNAILHNSIIFKGVRDEESEEGTDMVAERGLLHTNMIHFADGGSGQWRTKAHEDSRIRWGAGAGEWLDFFESAISGRPPKDREAHPLWVTAVQGVSGLPRALSQMYTRVFGVDTLATVRLRFPLQTTGVRRLGQRYVISGAITTDIPHLSWQNAIVTEIETDIKEGTQEILFTLLPTPV